MTDPSAPLATIAIPTFNRAPLLPRAVAAACAQDYPSIEVLIVDNASTDDTETVCRELMRSNDRIRYIRQPSNLGPVRNFGTGLDQAHGHYFMWLADDDWISPNYVRRCVEELDEGHVLVVGADHRGDDPGGLPDEPVSALEPAPAQRIVNYLPRVGYNVATYGVGRTSDFRALAPLPTCLGGDWLWILMLLRLGTLKVATDAQVHRSEDGASTDLGNLAASLGGRSWSWRLPRVAVAVQIFVACLWDRRLRVARQPWRQGLFAWRAAQGAWLSIQAEREMRVWVRQTSTYRVIHPPYTVLKRLSQRVLGRPRRRT